MHGFDSVTHILSQKISRAIVIFIKTHISRLIPKRLEGTPWYVFISPRIHSELRKRELTDIHMHHKHWKTSQHRSLPRRNHCYRCASTRHIWMSRHCRSPLGARRCDRGRGLHCSDEKGVLQQMSTLPNSVGGRIRWKVNCFGNAFSVGTHLARVAIDWLKGAPI